MIAHPESVFFVAASGLRASRQRVSSAPSEGLLGCGAGWRYSGCQSFSPQRFHLPPDGNQLFFTVTCTKCWAKESMFSLSGRFPRHCSPMDGRSVCARSGAELLAVEERRVAWRVVKS